MVEAGAAVREYRVGDRDVFQSCDADEFSPAFHGSVLLPWPNRLRDGRYTFEGTEYQTAITEPRRMVALHGFSAWASWGLIRHDPSSALLALPILPSPGYPFNLECCVEYQLDERGLQCTLQVTNVGASRAAFGAAFHPYLSTGPTTLDRCLLRIDAGTRVTIDERLLPTGSEAVADTGYDYRTARAVGPATLDDAFTDVLRDSDGHGWIRLTGEDGRTGRVE